MTEERERAPPGIDGKFPSDSHLHGGEHTSQALLESSESFGARPVWSHWVWAWGSFFSVKPQS